MTTQLPTQQGGEVDVLAVMDDAWRYTGLARPGQLHERAADMAEARAAVAELIRVSQRCRMALPVLGNLIKGIFGEESGGAAKAEMLIRELDKALVGMGVAA